MKQRVISGVIIFIAAVALGWTGGPALALVLAVCSLIGYYEMTRALGVHQPEQKWNGPELVGLIFAAAYWVLLYADGAAEGAVTDATSAGPVLTPAVTDYITHANDLALLMILGVFFTEMTLYVVTFPRYHADQIVSSIFAFIYVPVMISCIYRSRYLPTGKYVYALIFFCSWICDTGAWLFGRLFGRHKAFPVLSPKKTVEGCIGGVVCGTLLCFGAGVLADTLHPENVVTPSFVIIGICGCLISMCGDLAASAIKRNHGIKDYGKVIPGHGGIMDRFDSIIFTAPVIYYLGVLLLTQLQLRL